MQLDAPTIAIVIFANFVALSVAWSYVVRSYPNLNAARFWQASNLVASAATAITLLRRTVDPTLPILIGNTLMIVACCLAWAGVRQFYGRPVPWRSGSALAVLASVLFSVFTVESDEVTIRIAIISLAQFILLGLMTRELLTRPEPRQSPGASLASIMTIGMMVVQAARSICAFAGVGGPISPVSFNGMIALAFLILIFATVMVNFGFVLMAIDRLRAEVVTLALVDDLTGIANRRHFLQRLDEACAHATRSNDPLALLILDLDGFKAINDGYGHGAGDESLRVFTGAAQARLRAGDLFARTGGDEFCIILPSTTLNEAALLARDLVKTCRKTPAQWNGERIALTASVGVAAWSRDIGRDSQLLITRGDQALYAAKRQGRDRLAVHEADAMRLTA